MSTPLIETVDLKKYFYTAKGTLHAVDDVSIKIEKGQTIGVVGESGCGKSTLGRTILRLLEATSGKVLYNGVDILKLNNRQMKDMRKKMQMIFQDPYSSLNARMSVSQLIGDPLAVYRIGSSRERTEQVRKLMDTVGLAPRLFDSYPHELDGGRRQRIGIARALALDPEFIVCDEPVSSLDVSIQAQILNLLIRLQDERKLTYMFITHNLSVVKHISTNIMVMYLGQCIEYAEKEELFAHPCHPYTQSLLDAVPKVSIRPEDKMKNIIRGEITSPINPQEGCRFASRCQYATKSCTGCNIPLREIAPGHFVACNRF